MYVSRDFVHRFLCSPACCCWLPRRLALAPPQGSCAVHGGSKCITQRAAPPGISLYSPAQQAARRQLLGRKAARGQLSAPVLCRVACARAGCGCGGVSGSRVRGSRAVQLSDLPLECAVAPSGSERIAKGSYGPKRSNGPCTRPQRMRRPRDPPHLSSSRANSRALRSASALCRTLSGTDVRYVLRRYVLSLFVSASLAPPSRRATERVSVAVSLKCVSCVLILYLHENTRRQRITPHDIGNARVATRAAGHAARRAATYLPALVVCGLR